MGMSHRDRFRLKSQVVERLTHGDGWTFDKTNLLFGEFGLETFDGNGFGPTIADTIANLSDDTLVELYSVVLDLDIVEVEGSVETIGSEGNWKPGYVRTFLSHSASHQKFVGEVADELAVSGIHGFVAHTTMTVSKPWQTQIEQALRSMQAFVALVDSEFKGSAWCQQEVGWALGRRVPYFVVRIGADPVGFIGRDQWPDASDNDARKVASQISTWVSGLDELGTSVVDGMFTALRSATNYFDAEAAVKRLVTLGDLTDEQFDELEEIWWSNDQLYRGVLPSKAMKPFYQENGRAWPPPRHAK